MFSHHMCGNLRSILERAWDESAGVLRFSLNSYKAKKPCLIDPKSKFAFLAEKGKIARKPAPGAGLGGLRLSSFKFPGIAYRTQIFENEGETLKEPNNSDTAFRAENSEGGKKRPALLARGELRDYQRLSWISRSSYR